MEEQIRFENGRYHTTRIKNDALRKNKPLPTLLVHLLEWMNQLSPVTSWDGPVPRLCGELKPHQRDALGFIMARNRSILALDMGLGKTITCIAKILIHLARDPNTRVLAVIPRNLMDNWRKELTTFAPFLDINYIKDGRSADFTRGDVVLVSSGLMTRLHDKIPRFDIMLVEEAHMAKNIDSQQSKALFRLSTVYKDMSIVLMTGTPAQGHAHVYGLLRLLHPVFVNWFHFRPHGLAQDDLRFYFADRYIVAAQRYISRTKKVFEFKMQQRAEELQAILRPFYYRLLKSQVGGLPDLLIETVIVGEVTATQRKMFEESLLKITDIEEKRGKHAADAEKNKLVMETMRLKLPFICNYIQTLLESGERFICFTHHHDCAKTIMDFLTDKKVGFIHIDGETPMAERTRRQDAFETDTTIRVGVLSYVCAQGLNFPFIQLCLFCERVWESPKQKQAEARLHRIGQTLPVTLQYLDLDGSMDVLMEMNVKRKIDTERFLLQDPTPDHRVVRRRLE